MENVFQKILGKLLCSDLIQCNYSTGPLAQDLTMSTGSPAQDLTMSTGPPAQDRTMSTGSPAQDQ
jgi:hypothetical protein